MTLSPWSAVLAAALVSCSTAAAEYPGRALRIVVPFAPGGSTDTLARIVGQRLAETWGQPVIVDNRPAAGGTVGTDLVAKAQPDGYTFVVGSIATMAIARAMHPNLPYDALRDFEHIGLWVTFPLTLIVPAGSRFTALKDLIAEARAKPGTLRYGSQGVGASAHIFAELMHSMARVNVVHVPYKGGAPALTAVLVGEVDYALTAVSTALAQVGAGKVRALAVTGAKPSASLPGVPPIASVVPGYQALNWHGLDAPAGIPRAVLAKVHAHTTKILREPAVQEKLTGLSMEIVASRPEEYRSFIEAQIGQWEPLVKASGARLN
jgi:tripartite-type tricarboxylate transporter receptor subunit TctC